jgi:hypothetical protein
MLKSPPRVLASMRPIDRDFLLGRASFEQLAGDLPAGVPAHLAAAYAGELSELVETGVTVDESEAAQEVAFTGTADEVMCWLEHEDHACEPSK